MSSSEEEAEEEEEDGQQQKETTTTTRDSSSSGSTTLNHLTAIATFLKLHQALWRAHVVEFFKEKLWEKVDPEWLACLRGATVKDWLLLPSGITKDAWPASLKEFVCTAHSLALQRQPTATNEMLSAPIGNVLAQGMSAKKRHEIAALSLLVANVAKSTETMNVIDVGAGQGYLGLVLAFEYRMAVVAVDACAHHSNITNERAARIEKHYNARIHKTQPVGAKYSSEVHVPRTVTCAVGSGETHTALASLMLALHDGCQESEEPTQSTVDHNCNKNPSHSKERRSSTGDAAAVLAGLHACGDLSATMLRTFLECKEVKAVVNVGCCYNLLTEECCSSMVGATTKDLMVMSGFPLSDGVRRLGLQLGKNGRDLACQSAERWRDDLPESALRNFESHAFRAALQLILLRFYPETAISNPSVGRIGKARRRRQAVRHVAAIPANQQSCSGENRACDSCSEMPSSTHASNAKSQDAGVTATSLSSPVLSSGRNLATNHTTGAAAAAVAMAFEEYARLALQRLNLPIISKYEFTSVWESVAPYMDYVGPFWSLRAVLGPVLEAYILLDRLLYLEEHAHNNSNSTTGGITADLVPLFEPSVSPRNMVIVARRHGSH